MKCNKPCVFYKNYLHSDSDIQRHNNTFYLLFRGFFPFPSTCYRVFLPPQWVTELWRLHEIDLLFWSLILIGWAVFEAVVNYKVAYTFVYICVLLGNHNISEELHCLAEE